LAEHCGHPAIIVIVVVNRSATCQTITHRIELRHGEGRSHLQRSAIAAANIGSHAVEDHPTYTAIMQGFTPLGDGNKPRTSVSSRIRRVFKGPPKKSSTQYRDEKEQPYKHIPTHCASSFIKTTTTRDMAAAKIEQDMIDAMFPPEHRG